MIIKLEINEEKAAFFLEYLNSLKDGIIKNMEIKEGYSFIVSDKNEIKRRVAKAEESGKYTEHEKFWREFGLE